MILPTLAFSPEVNEKQWLRVPVLLTLASIYGYCAHTYLLTPRENPLPVSENRRQGRQMRSKTELHSFGLKGLGRQIRLVDW